MSAALHEIAPAKINLALHILGRRDDGYHDLESLVAFGRTGDHVALIPGDTLSLQVTGPMAAQLSIDDDNLILKATRALLARKPDLRIGAFTLEKHLPIASGIGGGSADAAAALRLIARANSLDLSDPDILAAARETGADVPVCIEGKARIMRGIGEVLDRPLALPEFAMLLVNPGIGVSTPAVFQQLGLARGKRSPLGSLPSLPETLTFSNVIVLLKHSRNDLEAPAIALEPTIGTVLDLLRASHNCILARMSGSGATVFGLYPDIDSAEKAMEHLAKSHPSWWMSVSLLQ